MLLARSLADGKCSPGDWNNIKKIWASTSYHPEKCFGTHVRCIDSLNAEKNPRNVLRTIFNFFRKYFAHVILQFGAIQMDCVEFTPGWPQEIIVCGWIWNQNKKPRSLWKFLAKAQERMAMSAIYESHSTLWSSTNLTSEAVCRIECAFYTFCMVLVVVCDQNGFSLLSHEVQRQITRIVYIHQALCERNVTEFLIQQFD